MKRSERISKIVEIVNQKGTVSVNELIERLNVSDMTIRRDLASLENAGELIRVHGGAKSHTPLIYNELTHEEKHHKNLLEKQDMAEKAMRFIDEGDSVFLGPGTSIEMLALAMNNQRLQVVTNCLPIFNILSRKKSDTFKVILIGGEMRERTKAFVGEMTNQILHQFHFSKMFFSCNGIKNGKVLTSDYSEAQTQKIAMKCSNQIYLLADSSKIGKEDFTSICDLHELSGLITNELSLEELQEVKGKTQIY